MMQSPSTRQLLLDIARCPVFMRAVDESACRPVLDVQSGTSVRQVPEPWSGDLEHAPILFISSNPSIERAERYPLASSSNDLVVDFFEHRFGGGQEPWTVNLHTLLDSPRTHSARHVSFWASARARATELLDRPTEPGKDFCLTEVVHCKSEGEQGVWAAAEYCSDRYLRDVISASGAVVVVVLGGIAAFQVRRLFFPRDTSKLVGPLEVGGKTRRFAFLPHPNARGPRTFALFDATEFAQLRRALGVTV